MMSYNPLHSHPRRFWQPHPALCVVVLLIALLLAVPALMDKINEPTLPADFATHPLLTIDGQRVTIKELSTKKPLLIYFWRGDCGVCRYLYGNVEKINASGGNVLMISTLAGDDIYIVRRLQGKHLVLPVINDPRGLLARRWGIDNTPLLLIVSHGEVVNSTSGWTSDTSLRLRLWWAKKWHRR